VVSQVALALWLVALGHSPGLLTATASAAVVLLAAAWVRVDRHWLFEWLDVAVRYAVRRRTLPAGRSATHEDALLTWLVPGARLVEAECAGMPAGVVADPQGWTALLEIGDPHAVLLGPPPVLPPTDQLLAPEEARVLAQLVVTEVRATGTGPVARAYQDLTGAPLPARARAVLAVRVSHVDGPDAPPPQRALSRAVRRISRRLAGVAQVRLLSRAEVLTVLAEMAHDDAGRPARERWRDLQMGGLSQVSYQLPAGLAVAPAAVPATAVTVTCGAIRLAARDQGTLLAAERALRRELNGQGGSPRPWSGRQRQGLAATLPLPRPAEPGLHSGYGQPVIGPAGLMLGRDRNGEAVLIRLFREIPTTVVVAGDRLPALLALRAMATGADVAVPSPRTEEWARLDPLGVRVGPSAPAPAPSALRPHLLVLEGAPVIGAPVPWRTVLAVRDRVRETDTDLLAGADLAVLPPLAAPDATLAATACGLPHLAHWLTRIRGDMVGVISRGKVRWVRLSTTDSERRLLGY
jgi:type VII secretion protein EccE